MAQIYPKPWTNENLIATQLDTDIANETDISVDILWYLFDENGKPIDEGRVQIADEDFASYNADKVDFPVVFIMHKLGLIPK